MPPHAKIVLPVALPRPPHTPPPSLRLPPPAPIPHHHHHRTLRNSPPDSTHNIPLLRPFILNTRPFNARCRTPLSRRPQGQSNIIMSLRLAAILPPPSRQPINRDDADKDAVDGGDVIHIYHSISNTSFFQNSTSRSWWRHNLFPARTRGKQDSLSGSTGLTVGKEYMISVKHVQTKSTQFAKRPRRPIQKGPWGMLFRPRMRRQMTGME